MSEKIREMSLEEFVRENNLHKDHRVKREYAALKQKSDSADALMKAISVALLAQEQDDPTATDPAD